MELITITLFLIGLFLIVKNKPDNSPKKELLKRVKCGSNNYVPPLIIDKKEQEYKMLESYRVLCLRVLNQECSIRVLTDVISRELHDGHAIQYRRVEWFKSRGIAMEYENYINHKLPLYFMFTTHEEVDVYFDKYISADSDKRVDIDNQNVRKMREWEEQQHGLFLEYLSEEEHCKIAKKIKEQHRKRLLTKQIKQQLMDSGELFGDRTKRPPIPRDVADAVWRRDRGRCVYCGATENLQYDHIIPFSKGGATSLENLQLLCQKCNLEKSNHIG